MDFLFLSIASGCFVSTNFNITLLLESLLNLETGKRWNPSMSFGSTSTSESWQMSIKTFSRLFSGISFGIPDNSILLHRLYCSDLAWLFALLNVRPSSTAEIPEPQLQFSQTRPHFIRNQEMNPVNSWNVEINLHPGVCGLKTSEQIRAHFNQNHMIIIYIKTC